MLSSQPILYRRIRIRRMGERMRGRYTQMDIHKKDKCVEKHGLQMARMVVFLSLYDRAGIRCQMIERAMKIKKNRPFGRFFCY